MDIVTIAHIIKTQVSYPDYTFELTLQQNGETYLQASYMEPCVVTGHLELQKTRKWKLSEHMTKSEVVQTAFKCIMTSAEHRVREHFKYKGELIFGPHFDVDALHDLAARGRLDLREEWPKPEGVKG